MGGAATLAVEGTPIRLSPTAKVTMRHVRIEGRGEAGRSLLNEGALQDVVENLVQRDAVFVASFGNAQTWSDVLLELFLR